jgi:sugar lactone lactonase YvrE
VPGSVTFNFNPAGGAVSDFSRAGTTTCTTGIQPASTVCILAVAFNPTLPGIRKGVVEVDFTPATGPAEPILYLFLSGLGSAAQIALGDATQQVLNSSLLAPQSVTFNPADPANSTLYVADSYAAQISTLASSGGSLSPWNTANAGNLAYPIDMVFDAFGNLIVADYNAGKVFSFDPALAEQTINTGTIIVGAPGAVKVDSAGDVFIADDSNAPKVVMVPGETYDSTYKPSVLLDSTSVSYPQALAVDNSGANLYVGDGNTNQVLKVALNGTGASQVAIAPCAATVTPCAFNAPTGFAFDLNGDMYVTDASRLLMIPANHSSGGQTVLVPMTGLVNPTNVSVDGSGNIYVTDYVGTLTKLSVNAGAMKVAASGPQTTTVTNTGNLDLTIGSLTFTNGAGSAFSETDTCTSAPISPGGSCTITVSYSNPAGTPTDTLSISSNAFSLSGVTIQLSTNISPGNNKSPARCEHGACFSPGMPVAKLRERNQTTK